MSWMLRPHGKIFYTAAGSGDTGVVFVHGALCSHEDWSRQWDYFAARHAVLTLDLNGHGQSANGPGNIGVMTYAGDLVALCEERGFSKVWLIGHSMGCRVILQACVSAPERVAGLVFIDGAYLTPGLLTDKTPAEREALAQAAIARANALYEAGQGPGARAQRGFSQMFFDPRFNAERDAMIERARQLPPYVARELMPDFAAWDLRHMEDALAQLKVPVLALACTYMNAAHERVTLAPGLETPWLQALKRHVPQHELVRMEGAGHFPMIEDPARVNALIEDFIARHPA